MAVLKSSITINYHETATASTTNPISIGNLPVENVYFGTRQVKKVYLGNTLVWEKEETIISFTIEGTSYQATEGMTWGEWVSSQYNTDGFKKQGNYIVSSQDFIVVTVGNTEVNSSDTIVAGTAYYKIGGSCN